MQFFTDDKMAVVLKLCVTLTKAQLFIPFVAAMVTLFLRKHGLSII